MAKFSQHQEFDGNSMSAYQLIHLFDEALDARGNGYPYWSALIKDYRGKDVEIKITDIEKDKEYRERGVVK